MGKPATEVAKYDKVVSGILDRIHRETNIDLKRLTVFHDAIFIKDGTDQEFATLERIMREDADRRGLHVVNGKWRKK